MRYLQTFSDAELQGRSDMIREALRTTPHRADAAPSCRACALLREGGKVLEEQQHRSEWSSL